MTEKTEDLVAELRERARRKSENGHITDALLMTAADALAAQPVLDPDSDERVIAWERVADHPALKPCYAEERPLLFAVLDRLTNLFELEQTVTELAPAPVIVLDPEKVAEVIEYYFDVPSDRLELIARALCEAYKEGKLT